jgi:hypothetical protein
MLTNDQKKNEWTQLDLLQSLKWEAFAHSSHSPGLAPSDYNLFSKLKESLAGKNFSDDDEVHDVVMTWLNEQVADFYHAGIKRTHSQAH